ncbi:MAG: hypothetical protein E7311_07110 [Clostridiales bacterium]|nr:hypothetical protein [Clostridiales bacterium]
MKNLKNNKTSGVSLVALIVTIIVLIILTAAVIVTFIEGGIIDRAKESVFKSDIRTYQEILAVKRAEEQIKLATGNGEEELKLIDKTITGEKIKEVLPEFKVEEYGELIEVANGEIVAKKELDEEVLQEKWLIDLGIKTAQVADVVYNVGEEISITDSDGKEHSFYVMEDSGSTLTLLAKGAINTTTYTQENPNDIAFSETPYWYDGINDEYITMDLNDYEVVKAEGQEGKAYALEAAIAYGEKLGGTGRLMTYTEAISWQDGEELATKLFEVGEYWLGTLEVDYFWAIKSVLSNGEVEIFAYYSLDTMIAVRPVITISESAVN